MTEVLNAIDIAFAPQEQSIKAVVKSMAVAIAREDHALETMGVELKSRKDALDALKNKLAMTMVQAGMQNCKLDNGLTPSVIKGAKYFKASGVNDETLQLWLRAHDLGDIIKQTVHFGTLQSTIKAYIEAGGKVDDNIFNVSEVTTIRMNGKSAFIAKESL